MVILTDDTHRDFSRIFDFCEEYDTTPEDILVILGDAGINYFLDDSDRRLKQELASLPVTLFLIRGNHEEYPGEISSYQEIPWNGGIAYREPEFPNLIFARDGGLYRLEGRSVLTVGGAYSIDKYARLRGGAPWFASEQPDETAKRYGEEQLEQAGWRVDYVFSHTCPRQYQPRHAFLPGLNQSLVDNSTERWLDSIEVRLSYNSWYCGHYHIDDRVGPVCFLQDDFLELDTEPDE